MDWTADVPGKHAAVKFRTIRHPRRAGVWRRFLRRAVARLDGLFARWTAHDPRDTYELTETVERPRMAAALLGHCFLHMADCCSPPTLFVRTRTPLPRRMTADLVIERLILETR